MSLLITNPQVEFASTPFGLDEQQPRFSYELESDRRGARQISRRIVVKDGDQIVWDSGEVKEGQCPSVRYAGEPLAARTWYDVEITVTDDASEKKTYRGQMVVYVRRTGKGMIQVHLGSSNRKLQMGSEDFVL